MVKRIPLVGKRGEGLFMLVDEQDHEALSAYRWHLHSQGYAAASAGYGTLLLAHKLILNTGPGQKIDHWDGDKLNNTTKNLRVATHAQNLSNRGPHKHRAGKPCTSRYKGVWWNPRRGLWMAEITSEGKRTKLGAFAEEEAAARAYDLAARELHGEFARPNFREVTA